MAEARLRERGVVQVAGDDAESFLQGLVTTSVAGLGAGDARFGALLTPQGKIVIDFFITPATGIEEGGFLMDVPRFLAPDVVRKLSFYKLRARVTIRDLSDQLSVTAVWDQQAPTGAIVFKDPRALALGWRVIGTTEVAGNQTSYDAHRIALGIPEGGRDYAYGDAFPHEAAMDQLYGVAFDKGCYVGQEVVSRMQHRGTARTRIVSVTYAGPQPADGVEITAGDKVLGTFGSGADGFGIALLRLDRLGDALQAGSAILAGGTAVTITKPAWATYPWPGEA